MGKMGKMGGCCWVSFVPPVLPILPIPTSNSYHPALLYFVSDEII